MHEYSIVQSLLESCEEHARTNDAKKVTKVVVKIGVLSGVEPDLLQTAFDTFKEQTVCHDAVFLINHQKVVIECFDCNTSSTLEKNEFSLIIVNILKSLIKLNINEIDESVRFVFEL